MSTAPKRRFSLEEYLALEDQSETKNEFYNAEIFAMSGGAPQHNDISVNVIAALKLKLQDTTCRPQNSDQRIRIPSNSLVTYPDASIVCGERQFDETA
ncbi:MAG: hypothetical protein CMJ78_15550 [Planctomycetaceae bacterium]|nr:hypothetical protein [Planctomycetaceae bacterium]